MTRPPNSSIEEADPVTFYAQQVIGGAIVAGPHVRAACRRHIRDLREGEARGLRFDPKAADRIIRYFPTVLRLAGGQFEGEPFNLHASQKFIVGSIGGWMKYSKRHDRELRRYRRAFIEEGKGNGKSPLAAGIGMYFMLSDKEPRAEVYAAATKKDQAMVLFRDAVAFVDQSPALRHRVSKSGKNPVWNLSDIKTQSFFRPIANEDGQSGPRPSCALCDEIHEHKDGTTIEMLERGFKWRRQPLLVMITNSGSDVKSVCYREHEAAIKVAHGDMELDELFSYVCALDEGDDPLHDPTCWPKANPLLGVTVSEEELDREVRQAIAIPGTANSILRLRFCVWTDAPRAWLARRTVEAVLADYRPAVHRAKKAFLGLDLSATRDLTALAAVVPTGFVDMPTDDGRAVRKPTFDAFIEAWTPRDTMQIREDQDKAPYRVWVQKGFLHAPPGENVRLDFVAVRVAELSLEYDIEALAYDRYAFRHFREELDKTGVTITQLEHPQGGIRRAKAPEEELEEWKRNGGAAEEMPQGLWMPGSLKALEEAILERRIRLLRNPVLISAIMSAVTEEDAFSNRWFSKRKATNRIDPVVALAMAFGAAVRLKAADEDLSGFLKRPVIIG